MALGIGLQLLTYVVNRLTTDPNLAGNLRRRVSFTDPSQQQHYLGRTKISPFKYGLAIQIIDTVTTAATVYHQLTFLSLPKLSSLRQTCTTMRTD
jgi:hypothetical protein